MEQLLSQISFFKGFSPEQLTRLAQISLLKNYAKDELLFYEGESSEYLLFLLKGTLKIYKATPKGTEITLHRLLPGNFIAEIANFENIPYPANARFLSSAEVLKIHYESLKNEFFCDQDFMLKLLSSVSRKVLVINEFVDSQMLLSAEAKLAKLLCENAELFEQIKQNQLASIINMAPETFSRLLAKFRHDGLISQRGKKIILDNEAALREFYE